STEPVAMKQDRIAGHRHFEQARGHGFSEGVVARDAADGSKRKIPAIAERDPVGGEGDVPGNGDCSFAVSRPPLARRSGTGGRITQHRGQCERRQDSAKYHGPLLSLWGAWAEAAIGKLCIEKAPTAKLSRGRVRS